MRMHGLRQYELTHLKEIFSGRTPRSFKFLAHISRTADSPTIRELGGVKCPIRTVTLQQELNSRQIKSTLSSENITLACDVTKFKQNFLKAFESVKKASMIENETLSGVVIGVISSFPFSQSSDLLMYFHVLP